LAIYLAAKIRGKQVVYDSHEYFTEVPELIHNPKAKAFWERIEKSIFPKLTKCMTVCDSIANIYKEKYNVNITVVRNVPFKLKKNVVPIKIPGVQKPIILYQGAVNLGRGIELMIDAMKYIETAQLVIVGGGDKLEELTSYVNSQLLQDKVIFIGRVHFSQLPSYTCQAAIGVSLEENLGMNYLYALPNKIFDYIQSQVPMIVSDLPEMKAIVTQYACGEILYERTPQALASIIEKLLSNDELRTLFIENSKIAAQELCWEMEKEKLLALYKPEFDLFHSKL